MNAAPTIYRNRGRLMKNRGGSWTLAFNVTDAATRGADRTGYVQLRGQRDALIEHAKTVGIKDVYLPGVVGLMAIRYVKAKLDEMESFEKKFAHLSDEELDRAIWQSMDFVSEEAEDEHHAMRDELHRRQQLQQGER